MEIELNIPETEITGKDISVETGNTNIAVSEDTKDLDITYNRKEYSIIGDGIFISSVLDDVPEWLGDLIDSTFEAAILSRDQNLINRMEAILTALDYVPKNKYTEQINQIVDEDGIINTRIATLNSNLTDALTKANATIAEIDLTYASKNEAAAIATNTLTASLSADGEIGSTLINLQNAYADLESTTAESITLLESVMEGEINGNASAMQTIRSYVGIDEAGASTGTGLSAYLEDSNGVIGGADSQLNNTIKVTAEGIESKFEYNSIVNINGIYKKSGFGLTTNYASGDGSQANPYVSEFWIDASRLKFTNSNRTGRTAPFTIDATGTTPKITFNGLVTFGSGQSGTIDEAIASTIETIQVGDKNINITDNLIPTTSLVGDINNSGYQFIGTPVKSYESGIDTFAEAQVTLGIADEVYSPYVDEMFIPYYFRFGIKNITDLSNFSIEFITGSATSSFNVNYTMIGANVLSVGNWYIVEGIINPTGGNTDTSGAIRTASGEKIATVNNAVIPSGAEKIVLGWKNSCVISRMKLSKITADTITADLASKDYVSSSISSSGYVLPSGVANAINTNTTTVDGAKITTGTINADKINTVGLIAENISAEEISGKIITGGQIIGANIAGVTIRASYLDLDGELEVLTNFYLCVGGNTTGVPALALSEGRYRTYSTADIDAVPSTSYSNLYRIPSISTVREETKVQTLNSTGASLVSKIRSYNCANAGHNVKCVKLRPRAFVSGFNIFLGLILGDEYDGYRNSSTAQMYFGGILLGSVYFRSYYYGWSSGGDQISSGVSGSIQVYLNGGLIYSYADSDTESYNSPASISPPSLNTTRTVNGIVIRIVCTSWSGLSFSIDNGEYELPASFNNTSESLFKVINSSDTAYSSITAYTNSATYINNMI